MATGEDIMSENGMQGKGTDVEMTLFLGADFIVTSDHRDQILKAVESVLLPDGVAGVHLHAAAWRQCRSGDGVMPQVNSYMRLHKIGGLHLTIPVNALAEGQQVDIEG
jgi:hypothetical protein